MGRNIKKFTLYLYNIPQDVIIPTFTSTAWSSDAQGPVNGTIAVVTMQSDSEGNLICYEVDKSILNNIPTHIKDILNGHKYLGIMTNAQLDSSEGKMKLISKMSQGIAITSKNTNSVMEARILHNMIICKVATFSPLCNNIH